jgi:hypothetical protein
MNGASFILIDYDFSQTVDALPREVKEQALLQAALRSRQQPLLGFGLNYEDDCFGTHSSGSGFTGKRTT